MSDKQQIPGGLLGTPLAYLAQSNISWEPPVETQSYNASLRALYIQGICAFTSTYAISADPRSSSAVITDLPDVIENYLSFGFHRPSSQTVLWQPQTALAFLYKRVYQNSCLITRAMKQADLF